MTPFAACVVHRTSNGLYLAVQRKDGSGWGLPGGKAEPGEVPGGPIRAAHINGLENTARREMYEETGCLANGLTFFHMREEPRLNPEGDDYLVAYFLAASITQIDKSPEGLTVDYVTKEALLAGPFGRYLPDVFDALDRKEREVSSF